MKPRMMEHPKKQAQKSAHHSDGMFSPLVRLSKAALGEERLNKIRAKMIALHSDTIQGFVDTADSEFGNFVLQELFSLADVNKNGIIDETELRTALHKLGFDFLKDKQIAGIFARGDQDANGAIDLDEWMAEAPKTLRTNLVKLAKNNGGKLGFLA